MAELAALQALLSEAIAGSMDYTALELATQVRDAALNHEDVLSDVLSAAPGLRVAFYSTLLTNGSKREAPQSFRMFVHSAQSSGTAVDMSTMQRLLQKVLEDCDQSSWDENTRVSVEEEVGGFLAYFSAKTGAVFDDTLTAVCFVLAQLLVGGSTTEGTQGVLDVAKSRLKRLFSLVYGLIQSKQLMLWSEAGCFAHSFEGVFRLLLQYHDPLLCTALDHIKIDVGSYALRMIRSLCAVVTPPPAHVNHRQPTSCCSASLIPLWDSLFLHNQDHLLPVFVVLVSLIERRSEVLEQCKVSPACVEAYLAAFDVSRVGAAGGGAPTRSPSSTVVPSFSVLPPCETVRDLVKKARIASRNTPSTAKTLLAALLFPDGDQLRRDPQEVRDDVMSFVALPVGAEELVGVFQSPPSVEQQEKMQHQQQAHAHHIPYVILDCRSADSFQFARLPTALHVGDTIGFDQQLLAKLKSKFENAKGSHLCILGTGRALVDEINLLKLVLLHLVQAGFPYVSIAVGGFKAMIPFIKEGKVEYVRGQRTPKRTASGAASPGQGSSSCLPLPPREEEVPASNAQPTASESTTLAVTKEAAIAKADELRHKAASWGWGVMKAISSKVESLTSQSVTASSAAAEPQPPLASSEVPNNAPVRAAPTSVKVEASASAPHPTGKIQTQARTSQEIFTTVDAGDDDEGLDLITCLPEKVEAATMVSPPRPVASSAVGGVTPESRKEEDDFIITSPPAAKGESSKPSLPTVSAPRASSTSSAAHHPFDDIFV